MVSLLIKPVFGSTSVLELNEKSFSADGFCIGTVVALLLPGSNV